MAQNVSQLFQDPEFRKKYYRKVGRNGERAWVIDGLRLAAQANGFIGNEVVRLELPTKENNFTAVVVEVVKMLEGDQVRVYTGVGDANPKNCNSRTANALVRMADTRALARAFRNALMIDEPVYVDGDIYEDEEEEYEEEGPEEPEEEEGEPEEEEFEEPPRRARVKAKVVARSRDEDEDDDWENVEDLESYFSDEGDEGDEFEESEGGEEEPEVEEEEAVDDLVDEINKYIKADVISLDEARRLSIKITGKKNPRQATRERVEALLAEIKKRARAARG